VQTSAELARDEATQELLGFLRARPTGNDRFEASGPDWHGDRVFGGFIVAQALSAAMQTADLPPHSLHGYFMRPEIANAPVAITVDRVRDGKTFRTRRATLWQDDKELFEATVSFHGGDPGDEYQMPMPDASPPEDLSTEPDDDEWQSPVEHRDVGPVRAPDGTFVSTRRVWERSGAVGDDPADHLLILAYLSDMTGTGFRPHSLDTWGNHADASLDHAVWFHRRFRTDEWLLYDLQCLINAAGRSTVRGCFYSRDGALVASMAQELLIRPV
jgi:acyl-CoA thioesterase-2